MRPYLLSFLAPVLTAGCVSTSTVQARRSAEAELARPVVFETSTFSRSAANAAAQPPASPASPASAAATPPLAPTTGTRSCESLAFAVAREHPRVTAGQARAKSALSRAVAEGSLPPPDATFEIWDFPIGDPSLADHEGMYMVGLGQKFPAAGSRDARSRAESESARAEGAEIARVARDVWSEVAVACADWSIAEAVRGRLLGHRALVADMREAVLAGYRAGAGSLAAVARTDAELAVAERHVAEADAEVSAARDTLLALAQGASDLPAQAPPLRQGIALPDVESLRRMALESRGELKAAKARQRSAEALADAAEADATSPSFEVRATYMQTPSMRAGLGAMVGMSLPWLWGDGAARKNGAVHDLEAARAEQDDAARSVNVEVTRAVGQVRIRQRALAALVEREIPAAQRALESERAALASGSFELASYIQAAHALREAHVDEARMRGELERAFIELEAAVGRPLPTSPTHEEAKP